jgi:hypothetical protein
MADPLGTLPNSSDGPQVKIDPADANGSVVSTAALFLVILLCSISCGLMFLLDPHSLDVTSVYQQF